MIASEFDSFDESPLGGFTESDLGDRGVAGGVGNLWVCTATAPNGTAYLDPSDTAWQTGVTMRYNRASATWSEDTTYRLAGGYVYGSEFHAAHATESGAGLYMKMREVGDVAWTTVGAATRAGSASDPVHFVEHGGELWAHGFLRIGGTVYVASRLESGAWVGKLAGTGLRQLVSLGGKLLAVGLNSSQTDLYEWDGATFGAVTVPTSGDYDVVSLLGFLAHDGTHFWCAGAMDVAVSGTTTTYLYRWNGASDWLPPDGDKNDALIFASVVGGVPTTVWQTNRFGGPKVVDNALGCFFLWNLETAFTPDRYQLRVLRATSSGTTTVKTLDINVGVYELDTAAPTVNAVDPAGFFTVSEVFSIHDYGGLLLVTGPQPVGEDLADPAAPNPRVGVWNGASFSSPEIEFGFHTAESNNRVFIDTGRLLF